MSESLYFNLASSSNGNGNSNGNNDNTPSNNSSNNSSSNNNNNDIVGNSSNIGNKCNEALLIDFDSPTPQEQPSSTTSNTTTNSSGNLIDFARANNNNNHSNNHNNNNSNNNFNVNKTSIPGLSSDSFSQKSRTSSTGIAREEFKKIYLELIPYYIDFRHKRKDSRLFKEYFDQRNQAKMLAKINNFGKINITSDSDRINSALETVIEYFENSALHHFELAYDSHNISEMQKWAHILLDLNGGNSCIQVFIQKNSIFFDHLYNPEENFINMSSSSPPKSPTTLSTMSDLSYQPLKEFFIYIEEELKRQATLIEQVFPHDADVFFTFTERVVEDVVSEYISTFLKLSHDHDILLYLKSVVIAYNRCLHVCKLIWRDIKPGLSKIRAEDLIFQMFV